MKPLVLVIYPDSASRDYLVDILEREGYGTIEALDYREGLESYAMRPTDLVIMDAANLNEGELRELGDFRRRFPDARLVALVGRQCEYHDTISRIASDAFQKPASTRGLLRSIEVLLSASPE